MVSSREQIEDLIHDLNGCGRYQVLSTIIMLLAESIAAWSMVAMAFNGQEPRYRCSNPVPGTNMTEANVSYTAWKTCKTMNGTTCDGFIFDDNIHTVVDEWDLVCDRKWIVAMVTTIQMAGVLVGCFLTGQLGDSIGRKPTFYLSLLVLVLFNGAAYFSVGWEMYAAIRFFIGSGVGGVLTVRYIILTEFMDSAWRPRIFAIPGWAANCALYALFIWALKDWKYLHIATAAVGIPFLLTYCFMQESSRWQMTKHRFTAAENTINTVARVNNKPKPNLSKLFVTVKEESRQAAANKTKTTYTFLDLFKSASNIRMTLGLLFIWFSISYSYYGLTFGVGKLAGNFYLNMFLMNIIETPTILLVIFSLKRFGRRKSCAMYFMVLGLCGTVAGAFQYIDTPARDTVVTTFAMISKMTISVAWGCLNVYTTELYPTVVRTIGVGVCNTAARVGGMLAPQTVFLGDEIPGLLYFPNAALSVISGLLCLLFTETRDRDLEDTFESETKRDRRAEKGQQSVYTVDK